MAFTPVSKAILAAGLVGAGLMLGTSVGAPVSASVLVDPMIRREGSQPAAVPAELPADSGSQNIVEIASSTDDFGTLTAAIQAANLTGILSAEGPYTVFAPTDAAFSALPLGTLDALLIPENRDLLVQLLYNHVGYGDVTSNQLVPGSFATFDGEVSVGVSPNGVMVGGANVVRADVDATNGVIHAVDKVLLPAGFENQLQARMTGEPTESATTSTTSTSTTSDGSSSTTSITRTTTLQETAIDRSVAPAATPAPEASEPAEQEAVVEEPVRGLW
ncbi:MAG: fasciclin domain-containing protein [Cyanobacteria bacterium P01_F01_bin.53]